MEFPVQRDPDSSLVPWSVQPSPGIATSKVDSLDDSSFILWDWHSYLIIGLIFLIGYHVWSFRPLYVRFYELMSRSLRNRVLDAGVQVSLTVTERNVEEVTSVVLLSDDRELPLTIESIDESETGSVLSEDTLYLECLE